MKFARNLERFGWSARASKHPEGSNLTKFQGRPVWRCARTLQPNLSSRRDQDEDPSGVQGSQAQ